MNSGDIKFGCPHCQQHIETPFSAAGNAMSCPRCKEKIVVPTALSDRHPTAIVIQRKTLILAVAAVVIAAAALVVTSALRKVTPKTIPDVGRTEQERPAQALPVESEPPPLLPAPSPEARPIAESSPTPSPAVPSWERQNRDILIRMITDGHVYFVDNQPLKALGVYGLLFDLIGTNTIQDAMLRKLIDQAGGERDQITRTRQETKSQASLLFQGAVSLAKNNGERVSPPTEVFLARDGSPAAQVVWSLVEHVRDFDVAHRFAESTSDAGDFEAAESALLRMKRAAKHIIDCTQAIPNLAAASTKTDAQGHFVFSELPSGKYCLAAMAYVDDHRMLWAVSIDKEDAPLTITLDNDSALIVDGGGWWEW